MKAVTSNGPIKVLFALDQLNSTIRQVEAMIAELPPFSSKRKKWTNCMDGLYELRDLFSKEVG